MPTFFFTVSSADNYWPQLHSLMPHDNDTHSMLSLLTLTSQTGISIKNSTLYITGCNKQWMLNGFGMANVDLQVIVDVIMLVLVLWQSTLLKVNNSPNQHNDVLSYSISSANAAPSILRQCIIQSVGERDFSVQETAHLLIRLPLYRCTYNFITLSLNGGNLIIMH